MLALKIAVGAAAALLVGAASAQMLEPWQAGEAWGGFESQIDGAKSHAYDGSVSAEPAQLTSSSDSTATGAMGRPFGEPEVTRDMGSSEIDFNQSSQASEIFLGD